MKTAPARGAWRVEAPPTQGTLSEDPLGSWALFEGSPGLCSNRPRESVRVPLLASRGAASESASGWRARRCLLPMEQLELLLYLTTHREWPSPSLGTPRYPNPPSPTPRYPNPPRREAGHPRVLRVTLSLGCRAASGPRGCGTVRRRTSDCRRCLSLLDWLCLCVLGPWPWCVCVKAGSRSALGAARAYEGCTGRHSYSKARGALATGRSHKARCARSVSTTREVPQRWGWEAPTRGLIQSHAACTRALACAAAALPRARRLSTQGVDCKVDRRVTPLVARGGRRAHLP